MGRGNGNQAVGAAGQPAAGQELQASIDRRTATLRGLMATPSWSAQRSGSAGWLRQDDSSRPAPASGLVAASAGGGAGCSRATINHLVAGQQRVPKIAIAVDLSRVLELNGAEYDRFDGRGGAG